MRRCTLCVAAVAALTILATGCDKLKARDKLNRGVQAYKGAQYSQAVDHFKEAVARLYLATAYMMQYIPGAESPENVQMAKAAHDQFQKVLEQDPNNDVAIASIASLFFNQKRLNDAEQWYHRLIQVKPDNKEAYYTLGVIAWTKTFQPRMEARAKMGMKPEDPGPLKDKKVRDELRAKNSPTIDDGIKNLEKALQIDTEYDDAMAYLNLLNREKADLEETSDAYKADTKVADDWVQKALQTKKIKSERKPAGGGITAE
jgi:tetratricopeptide (TPR) repeat protein